MASKLLSKSDLRVAINATQSVTAFTHSLLGRINGAAKDLAITPFSANTIKGPTSYAFKLTKSSHLDGTA